MPLYLLDTIIISDAIRNTRDSCATRIEEVAPENLCTSIIVAAELRFGAEKKGSPELAGRVERALASLSVMVLSSDADRFYGPLRADLERRGQLIGANDMLIATHALAVDAAVVTGNTEECSRVQGAASLKLAGPQSGLRWCRWRHASRNLHRGRGSGTMVLPLHRKSTKTRRQRDSGFRV